MRMEQPLYTVTGHAIHGKRLGARLGFPTANIAYDPGAPLMPRDGVYIASVWIDGEDAPYVSILNQGRHPTAPEGRPVIEAHLLGYGGGDLYGRKLTLNYQQYLRPEQKFLSLARLKEQLGKDRSAAMAWAQSLEAKENP